MSSVEVAGDAACRQFFWNMLLAAGGGEVSLIYHVFLFSFY